LWLEEFEKIESLGLKHPREEEKAEPPKRGELDQLGCVLWAIARLQRTAEKHPNYADVL